MQYLKSHPQKMYILLLNMSFKLLNWKKYIYIFYGPRLQSIKHYDLYYMLVSANVAGIIEFLPALVLFQPEVTFRRKENTLI